MRIVSKVFLTLSLCLASFSTLAQQATRADFDACTGSGLDMEVMARSCSALISDTRLPAAIRSIALLKRGFTEYTKQNFDQAAADFREAIRLDQTNAYAHHELGMVHFHRNELDAALTAMDAALRIEPKSTATHYMRGHINIARNQYQSALLDFNRAIYHDPLGKTVIENDGQPVVLEEDAVRADYFSSRAVVQFILGELSKADKDHSIVASLSPAKQTYLLLQYVVRVRSGDKTSAALLNSTGNGSSKLGPVAKALAGLFLGEKTPDDVMAAATDDDQRCTANFFIGQWYLLKSQNALAKPLLMQARDRCKPQSMESIVAIAQSRAL